ncbi:uncharacterized protein LOC141915207 [Tubulanus polymorphus]|uniref:uncharacterized protein LOC141915207 n=1 Tax=Tubulanus polymorphus TaxID=672921 RepID=UPI003DA1C93E
MQSIEGRQDDYGTLQYSSLQASLNVNGQRSPQTHGFNSNDFNNLSSSGVGTSQHQVTVVKRHASDMDSESEDEYNRLNYIQQPPKMTDGPKPGKKTKGRVKIKMEFIENKLRRYTTFSKRKTGIMKKAYELSTLTGTQVMLLVASETGHVYTFATRKLQPMITSESGKALIQTCLNSPDEAPVEPGQQHDIDQRMNPTGFEETDLTYAVTEEENNAKMDLAIKQTLYSLPNISPQSHSPDLINDVPTMTTIMSNNATSRSSPAPPAHTTVSANPQLHVMQSYLSNSTNLIGVNNSSNSGNSSSNNNTSNNSVNVRASNQTQASISSFNGKQSSSLPVQLPPGVAAILSPGTSLPAGAQITSQLISTLQNQQQQQQAALLRIPTLVSGASSATNQTESSNSTTNTITPVYVTGGSSGTSTSQAPTMMYQTPQGIVYAASSSGALSSSLPEGYILNLQQTPTAIAIPGQDGQGGTQQFLTFPLPAPMLQLAQQQQQQQNSGGNGNEMAINLSDTSQKRK